MYEQISSNKRRTVLLVFFMVALFVGVGYAIGYLVGGASNAGIVGIVVAFVIASTFRFAQRPFFEIEEPVRGPVQVEL